MAHFGFVLDRGSFESVQGTAVDQQMTVVVAWQELVS